MFRKELQKYNTSYAKAKNPYRILATDLHSIITDVSETLCERS